MSEEHRTLTTGIKRERDEGAKADPTPYAYDGDEKDDVERLAEAARKRDEAEKKWEKRVDRVRTMIAKKTRRV